MYFRIFLLFCLFLSSHAFAQTTTSDIADFNKALDPARNANSQYTLSENKTLCVLYKMKTNYCIDLQEADDIIKYPIEIVKGKELLIDGNRHLGIYVGCKNKACVYEIQDGKRRENALYGFSLNLTNEIDWDRAFDLLQKFHLSVK